MDTLLTTLDMNRAFTLVGEEIALIGALGKERNLLCSCLATIAPRRADGANTLEHTDADDPNFRTEPVEIDTTCRNIVWMMTLQQQHAIERRF